MSWDDQQINLKPWAISRAGSAILLMAIGLVVGFQKPSVPVISSPKPGSILGEAIVKISGQAIPGSVVIVERKRTKLDRAGDKPLFVDTCNADENGDWEMEQFFDEGKNEIWAFYELEGGRRGANSEKVKFELKFKFEEMMTKTLEITSHDDGGEVIAGDVAVTGLAPAGARVRLTLDGNSWVKSADESGSWAFNLSMKRGEHKIKVETLTKSQSTKDITLTAK